MLLTQVILIIFLIFALTRVILRFREGQLGLAEFIFWGLLFTAATIGVLIPESTTKIARFLGIGRGADLAIYVSIVALFYLVFRIYIMLENVHQEITELIRQIALQKEKDK